MSRTTHATPAPPAATATAELPEPFPQPVPPGHLRPLGYSRESFEAAVAETAGGDVATVDPASLHLEAYPRIIDSKIGLLFTQDSFWHFQLICGRAAMVATKDVREALDRFFREGTGRPLCELRERVRAARDAIGTAEVLVKQTAAEWEKAVLDQVDQDEHRQANRAARLRLEDATAEHAVLLAAFRKLLDETRQAFGPAIRSVPSLSREFAESAKAEAESRRKELSAAIVGPLVKYVAALCLVDGQALAHREIQELHKDERFRDED